MNILVYCSPDPICALSKLFLPGVKEFRELGHDARLGHEISDETAFDPDIVHVAYLGWIGNSKRFSEKPLVLNVHHIDREKEPEFSGHLRYIDPDRIVV